MTDNKSGEILIIEDDKDINDLLATALSKAGYRTRQAWSGTEGELLLKLDREAYALLSDFLLPFPTLKAHLPPHDAAAQPLWQRPPLSQTAL